MSSFPLSSTIEEGTASSQGPFTTSISVQTSASNSSSQITKQLDSLTSQSQSVTSSIDILSQVSDFPVSSARSILSDSQRSSSLETATITTSHLSASTDEILSKNSSAMSKQTSGTTSSIKLTTSKHHSSQTTRTPLSPSVAVSKANNSSTSTLLEIVTSTPIPSSKTSSLLLASPTSSVIEVPANTNVQTSLTTESTTVLQPTTTDNTSVSSSITSSDNNWWIPTELITQAPETASTISSAIGGTQTMTLPQAVAAATQIPESEGYSLITVGFKKPLNYKFVVSEPKSSAQIFGYLPAALNTPFKNVFTNITVLQIVPLQNDSLDYLISVAEVYFPTAEVEELSNLIMNTSSTFYTDGTGTAKSMAAMVDPSIPLTGLLRNSNSNSSGSSDGSSSSDSNSGSSNSGSTSNSGDSSSSSADSYQDAGTLEYSSKSNSNVSGSGKSKKKIIGLVVGLIVGGCLYILFMIFAFRYIARRRIKSQQIIKNPETSSVSSSEFGGEKHHNNEKRMSVQESVTQSMRIQNWMDDSYYGHELTNDDSTPVRHNTSTSIPKISRPIASQNSLGWNEV